MEAPVFILGVHKSGTSLLRNLLDGHPALHAVPIELHFAACMGLPCQYPRQPRRMVPGGSREAFIANACTVLDEYNSAATPTADAFLPGRFDAGAFRRHLEATIAEGTPTPERLRHQADAVQHALGAEPAGTDRRLVEKSVDHLEHAAWLHSRFPGAHFLLIVRDPFANLVSLRRFVSRNGRFPSLSQPVRTIAFGFHWALLHRATLPHLLVLRYEDLVSRPEAEMRRVAAHLGIAWDPILLRPTTLGADWGGNSASGQAFQGISAERLEEWRQHITPIEADLLCRALPEEVLGHFGYRHHRLPGVWRRAPGEPWKLWLRNRAYRWFADGS